MIFLIFCGACDFDDKVIPGSTANTHIFNKSYELIINCLRSNFSDREISILDLFNDARSPSDQLKAISDTYDDIRERYAETLDTIFYYIGHGFYTANDFYLMIRSTWKQTDTSSISSKNLASLFNSNIKKSRNFFIIDSCYAARLVGGFQSNNHIENAFSEIKGGATILASSGKDERSYFDNISTAFTQSLCNVLDTGLENTKTQGFISFSDLIDSNALWKDISSRVVSGNAARPQFHNLSIKDIPLGDYPIFKNLATEIAPSTNEIALHFLYDLAGNSQLKIEPNEAEPAKLIKSLRRYPERYEALLIGEILKYDPNGIFHEYSLDNFLISDHLDAVFQTTIQAEINKYAELYLMKSKLETCDDFDNLRSFIDIFGITINETSDYTSFAFYVKEMDNYYKSKVGYNAFHALIRISNMLSNNIVHSDEYIMRVIKLAFDCLNKNSSTRLLTLYPRLSDRALRLILRTYNMHNQDQFTESQYDFVLADIYKTIGACGNPRTIKNLRITPPVRTARQFELELSLSAISFSATEESAAFLGSLPYEYMIKYLPRIQYLLPKNHDAHYTLGCNTDVSQENIIEQIRNSALGNALSEETVLTNANIDGDDYGEQISLRRAYGILGAARLNLPIRQDIKYLIDNSLIRAEQILLILAYLCKNSPNSDIYIHKLADLAKDPSCISASIQADILYTLDNINKIEARILYDILKRTYFPNAVREADNLKFHIAQQ